VTSKIYSCDELFELLHVRYAGNAFAVFPEVRNSTGYSASRSADAIVMALWPSAGFRITGIEIKATRSDWLRELKNPRKSQDMMRFCDEWLILANHGVVDLHIDAFPEKWGLVLPNGGGLKLVKPPQMLEERPAMERPFVAALLRRASEFALTKKQTESIRKEAAREVEQRFKREIDNANEKHERLRKAVEEFEKASGIHLNQWYGGTELGEAVKAVLRSRDRFDAPERRLKMILESAQQIVATVTTQLAALEQPQVKSA